MAPEKTIKAQNRNKMPWFNKRTICPEKNHEEQRKSLAEVPKSCIMESLHQRKE